MSFVSNLPADLIANLLNWMNPSDYISLDSSFCNHENRSHFLSSINREIDVNWLSGAFPLCFVSNIFLKWLRNRQFQLENFHCCNSLLSKHITLPFGVSKLFFSGMWKTTYYRLWRMVESASSSDFSMLNAIVMREFDGTVVDNKLIKKITRIIAQKSGSLTSCDLQYSSFTKEDLLFLCGHNPLIKQLVLSDENYCGDNPVDTDCLRSIIATCVHLTDLQIPLRIYDGCCGDEILTAIAQFGRNYQTLDISQPQYHNKRPLKLLSIQAVMVHCVNLTDLSLAHCSSLNDPALHQISELPLTALNISHATSVSTDGLYDLFSNCTTIQRLTISNMNPVIVDQTIFKQAPSFLSRLKYYDFNMIKYHAMGDRSFFLGVWNNFNNITSIDYDMCVIEGQAVTAGNITNPRWNLETMFVSTMASVMNLLLFDVTDLIELKNLRTGPSLYMFTMCKKLINVELGILSYEFPFNTLIEVVTNNPQLKSLDVYVMEHCFYNGKAILKCITETCSAIECIKLVNTDIDDESIALMVTKCKRLSSVDFSGCKQVTTEGYNCMLQRLQFLNYLYVERTGVPFHLQCDVNKHVYRE
jgi:hypothetical protein